MPVARSLIEGSPQASVSAPSQTTIGTTAAVILALNYKRKGFVVQNTGTTIIKLSFGSVLPTQTVYHVALPACAVADDGTGGFYFDDAFIGIVSAISSGASGTFVLTELMTGSPDWNQAEAYGT